MSEAILEFIMEVTARTWSWALSPFFSSFFVDSIGQCGGHAGEIVLHNLFEAKKLRPLARLDVIDAVERVYEIVLPSHFRVEPDQRSATHRSALHGGHDDRTVEHARTLEQHLGRRVSIHEMSEG